MMPALILFGYSIKRVRLMIFATGFLLACFQLILVAVARSIQISGSFEQISALLPPFVRELVGPSLTSFMSFSGIVCLGYFHPVVLASLVALSIAIGTIPASEVETGFIDLILSRPLARHWVVTRSIILGIVCILALLLMMLAGTGLGLATIAPANAKWPTPQLLGSLAINLGFLLFGWVGLALAIGSGARRRGVAGTVTGLAALATFLLDYIARSWKPAEPLAWLSPFRYFSPFELLMGTSLPSKNLLVLAVTGLIGLLVAYAIFSRRDISH